MAYTAIDNPELYFQTKLYTGNDADDRGITLDGSENMAPNLVWIKKRNNAADGVLSDSVRGAGKVLYTSLTNAEGSESASFDSFDSDGFTISQDAGVGLNVNTHTYVAWCWKESATAGFDIVSYTGNGSARTISHSLSAVPKLMIMKKRNSGTGSNWIVYHESISGTGDGHLWFDLTNDRSTDTDSWNNTAPTSSVFSVGTRTENNNNTDTFIAYLWSGKQGFSKFGSYTGNGNVDAPFLFCGMLPSFLMIKRTDTTSNWVIFDNKRGSYNEINNSLYPNSNGAEDTDTSLDDVDFVSNGVKIREDSPNINASGGTYVYMAFAEAPFVNSKGVPCNAR